MSSFAWPESHLRHRRDLETWCENGACEDERSAKQSLRRKTGESAGSSQSRSVAEWFAPKLP